LHYDPGSNFTRYAAYSASNTGSSANAPGSSATTSTIDLGASGFTGSAAGTSINPWKKYCKSHIA